MTSTLLILVLLEVGTGVVGLALYRWLPKAIARIEGDSQVEEDLLEEVRTLDRRRAELLEGGAPGLRTAALRVRTSAGATLGRYRRGYDPARAQALALEHLAPELKTLDGADARKLERLAADAVRLAEVRAGLWLGWARRSWLITHVGVTSLLLTLVVVHVVSVLYF